MRALLKTGEWVEIETAYLFHDQYNTADKRIFDRDIVRIEDDVRLGMGRCKYCGAMVRKGEEKKHFEEQENKGCKGCFWYRDKPVGNGSSNRKVTERIDSNTGETITTTIITTRKKYIKECSYKDKYPECGCSHKECRRMGIDWFTPENTFFLKYPNGFNSIPEIDKLTQRGFTVVENKLNACYRGKIGSYALAAILSYDSVGRATGIKYYDIRNARRHYSFRYEDGTLYIHNGITWVKHKYLPDVPMNVMEKVKAICCY